MAKGKESVFDIKLFKRLLLYIKPYRWVFIVSIIAVISLAVFGAIITIVLNFLLIPSIGFLGSAIATLACYFLMVVASYALANKHFPVPYNLRRIFLYFFLMIGVYFILYYTNFTAIINLLFVLTYLLCIYVLERPKIKKNKTPKLF